MMKDYNEESSWAHLLALEKVDGNFTPQLFINRLLEHLRGNERIQEGLHLLTTSGALEEIVETIPALLNKFNLAVQPFSSDNYTGIITDWEVKRLSSAIFRIWFSNENGKEENEAVAKALCSEIVFSLPYIFKQLGYQLIKPGEQDFVNGVIAEKIARDIHARYRFIATRGQQIKDSRDIYKQMFMASSGNEYVELDFDNLPWEIQQSNIDNAYHIPSILLSIGKEIKKAEKDEDMPLLFLSDTDVETMAMMEHQRWCWERRLNGYIYHPVRDDAKKRHNRLVPYDELPEFEKEKDRELVRLIPVLLNDIGFEALALDTGVANQLSYRPRAKSKIDEVKLEAEKLNEAIARLFGERQLPVPAEIDSSIKKLIDHSGEMASALSSAISIQRTFLPSPLMVREYLPDSFLLYKPKDGVGGDFYFVSGKFGATVWVCADCTGHGVAAGLLTALCYNFIDQAVNYNNITDPAAIIAYVMPKIESIMHLSDGEIVNSNGMELAVCTLYQQSRVLFYAGLNRPLYRFSGDQLFEIESIRFRDKFESVAPKLKTQIIQLNPNDTLYLTTDGFIDQLGGTRKEQGERFKNTRFKDLLTKIQSQRMAQQRESLNQAIEQWRQEANQEQTDDILVIGVKI